MSLPKLAVPDEAKAGLLRLIIFMTPGAPLDVVPNLIAELPDALVSASTLALPVRVPASVSVEIYDDVAACETTNKHPPAMMNAPMTPSETSRLNIWLADAVC